MPVRRIFTAGALPAVAAGLVMATAPAVAQTYTVDSITAPAFGTLVAATIGSTTYTNNGVVSVASGSGVTYAGPVTRGLVTIRCVDGSGNPRRCNNASNFARVTVGANGTIGGRAQAISKFTAVSNSGTVGAGTSTGAGPLSFLFSGWTAAGTRTFYLDVDVPIDGDQVGGTTGAASSGFYVRVDKDPAVPVAGLTGSVTATVRRSMQVNKSTDLRFGTIIRPPNGSGTITITTGGGRSPGGAVPPIAMTGVGLAYLYGAATYQLFGEPGTAFTLTVPASVDLLGPSNHLLIPLTPNISGSMNMDLSGSMALNIGGTVTISSSTNTGLYSQTFSVSVVYN
ncbi:DUF4402 domain-containing protein [Rhizorhabdus argentea]|uniref:DUF4402 domain-containing protein n=1 Tax=Rhizorhabdus argentea TaxID=1387174 RepID=UPI0030EC7C8E